MHVTFETASTVRRGSLIACVFFIASGLLVNCTAAADSTTSVSDDLRNHVVEILRGGLDDNDWRTRAQAAEALLKLDYLSGVVDAFQQQAEQVTVASNERVALYRLMAMGSHGEVARARWISQLRDIWLSSDSGRTAAAKALLQLGFTKSTSLSGFNLGHARLSVTVTGFNSAQVNLLNCTPTATVVNSSNLVLPHDS